MKSFGAAKSFVGDERYGSDAPWDLACLIPERRDTRDVHAFVGCAPRSRVSGHVFRSAASPLAKTVLIQHDSLCSVYTQVRLFLFLALRRARHIDGVVLYVPAWVPGLTALFSDPCSDLFLSVPGTAGTAALCTCNRKAHAARSIPVIGKQLSNVASGGIALFAFHIH